MRQSRRPAPRKALHYERARGLRRRNTGGRDQLSAEIKNRLFPAAVQDLQTDVAGSCSISRDKHYGNDSSGTYAGASSAPAPAGAETIPSSPTRMSARQVSNSAASFRT